RGRHQFGDRLEVGEVDAHEPGGARVLVEQAAGTVRVARSERDAGDAGGRGAAHGELVGAGAAVVAQRYPDHVGAADVDGDGVVAAQRVELHDGRTAGRAHRDTRDDGVRLGDGDREGEWVGHREGVAAAGALDRERVGRPGGVVIVGRQGAAQVGGRKRGGVYAAGRGAREGVEAGGLE